MFGPLWTTSVKTAVHGQHFNRINNQLKEGNTNIIVTYILPKFNINQLEFKHGVLGIEKPKQFEEISLVGIRLCAYV